MCRLRASNIEMRRSVIFVPLLSLLEFKNINSLLLFHIFSLLDLHPSSFVLGKPRGISHITNEQVKTRIRNSIGPYEDLTSAKRRKLRWYGHVTRSPGLAKTILQGTVRGGRRRSRQRKRWEDNITLHQRLD